MSVREVRFFLLWMAFPNIIRYKLNARTNIILHLFFLGELFHIGKCPLALKNARATFQRSITLIFHNIKKIIEVYLDDIATHSRLRVLHPYHLRLVFERCRHYQVCLNPHKCIFCVFVGRFLGSSYPRRV